jgi:hypothetical protein
MSRVERVRLATLLLLVVGLSFVIVDRVDAQDDTWSFVLTPQIWAAHIANNGFAAPQAAGIKLVNPQTLQVFGNPFVVDKSDPVDSLNPQWGIQFAAQKGRWTLAGSFQYVNFETRNDIVFDPAAQSKFGVDSACAPRPFAPPNTFDCVAPGGRFAQEFIDTTRLDMDFSASYFFPDVVPRWLDFSVGGGVKVIYASASRKFNNQSAAAVDTVAFISAAGKGNGLYEICTNDDCSEFGFRDRVKTSTWLYGATIPMSGILHLTSDARWLLPLNVMPFIGAETRNDRDVVYEFDSGNHVLNPLTGAVVPPLKVNRIDGTTFAYGVTVDATVRYLINEAVSAYTGMRVQYIKGHEKYLAYGPLFGLSVRFGGK